MLSWSCRSINYLLHLVGSSILLYPQKYTNLHLKLRILLFEFNQDLYRRQYLVTLSATKFNENTFNGRLCIDRQTDTQRTCHFCLTVADCYPHGPSKLQQKMSTSLFSNWCTRDYDCKNYSRNILRFNSNNWLYYTWRLFSYFCGWFKLTPADKISGGVQGRGVDSDRYPFTLP